MGDEQDATRVREAQSRRIAVVIVVLTAVAFAAWWSLASWH
jgi:hypothetical protein